MLETELIRSKLNYAADPAIDILLDKSKIAQIKVKEIDARIRDIEAEQYKIK